MKKKIVLILTMTMSIGLVACGSSTSSTTETSSTVESVAVETQVAEVSETEASTVETEVSESTSGEAEEIEVGGPYPASTAWDEYAVVDYHFDETDEDVTMTVQANTAHDTFDMQFDFFGDKQQITFHSDNTVDYDMTGFMTKDVEKLNTFVEEITDWTSIDKAGASMSVNEATEVEVGGPYPASTAWDEYAVVDYHFDETDEDVTMTVQANTAHDTFDMQFDFFGDKQQITFHSDETVDYDMTGFMTKDVKKLIAFTSEITDWAPIE
jgi:hypothetical protein